MKDHRLSIGVAIPISLKEALVLLPWFSMKKFKQILWNE